MNMRIARLIYFAALATTIVLGPNLVAQPRSSLPLTVTVSSDGRDLEIKRVSEAAAVRVHILNTCGNPAVGEPKIRHIQMEQENVTATYGKHCCAKVSLKTFGVERTGCN